MHVIGGLRIGGAELFLERLIQLLGDREFQHQVVSLSRVGPVGERMQRSGVQVEALHIEGLFGAAPGLFKLRGLLHCNNPELVQSWLYHGNLAAGLAMRMDGVRCPLIWNVRHSLDQWAEEKFSLRSEIRVSGRLAGIPERIIFNSSRSARQHERLGYPRAKACVIPNGFDLTKFAPNSANGAIIRTQLGISSDDIVLGMCGRFHPLKDHAAFLHAAQIVADGAPHARFLLAGRQVTAENSVLMKRVRELNLGDRVLMLGERSDVPGLLNACDIYVSSSSSEAFPNAVGEAMSSGVPCVVTDAGDSAELVRDTGVVVPVKLPEKLAEGMLQLIRAGADRRREFGAAARERIRLNYSNEDVARRYADLYRSARGLA